MFVTGKNNPDIRNVGACDKVPCTTSQPISVHKKHLLKMKLLALLIFAGCLQLRAGHAQNMSLHAKNISLKEVFAKIKKQTGYVVFYNEALLPAKSSVSINVNDVPVAQLLDQCLSDFDLAYSFVGNNIVLKKTAPAKRTAATEEMEIQQVKITGTVQDEDGNPLGGATIQVKGSNTTVTSEQDGSFSIDIPGQSAILVISFVGMDTKEVTATTGNAVLVRLSAAVTTQDEVVVIGYGNTRRQDLLGAVSTVKLTDNFKGRPASLGNILQGQMPGVNITQSGDPTSSGIINIRGKGNRNGDGVLIVVDGVPNAPYNPADIETVTVLKDASSAAIYGAFAGSGGVVLITTKQAKAGKMTVDANVWQGTQSAWRTPKVLTAEQFNMVWKDASTAAGTNLPEAYDPAKFPYGNVTRTDWVNEIFRAGKLQHYDVTIRGGTDAIKALASVSYDDVQGTLRNTFNKKLTTRLNVDFKLSDYVEIGQHILYETSNGQSAVGDGHTGTIFGAMAYPRFNNVYETDDDGNVLYSGTVPRWALADGISVEADLRNPVAMLEKVKQYNPGQNVFSRTSLRIKPMKGLTFRSEFAITGGNGRRESFQQRFLEPGRTIDMNYRIIQDSMSTRWTWDNILTYNKLIGKHDITGMAGFILNRGLKRWNRTEVRNFDSEDPHYTLFGNGLDWTSIRPAETIGEETVASTLARVSYSYDDRYFMSASLRRDASSKLSPTNNSDVFPAVSASWKLSSERFMESLEAIDLLKVRASWGQVGNVGSVRPFIYAPPYQMTGWPLFMGTNGEIQAFGIFQPTIANPNLKWERTEQINIGIDVSLFKKLNATLDYFSKLTKDLIETLPMPSVAGVASPPEFNIGQVENKGWEFSLNYNNKVGAVDFNIGGNIGTYKNKVLDIGPRDFLPHDELSVNSMLPLRSKVGQPWHSFYLIEAEGIFRSQREIDEYTWTNPAGDAVKIQPFARPGDLKFRDANNDGSINEGDRVYMGSYDMPKFSYGFNLGANWKGFSLSVFFQGVSGIKIYNGVKAMTYTGSKGWNMSTDVLDSYNYNPTSNIPNLAIVEDPNGNYSKASSYFLDKADYMRLKNLHLSYTLPTQLMSGSFLHGKTVRIYANGENLLTFTGYKAFDPEVGNFGIDRGQFPVSRMFSVGMNVTF